MNWIPISIRVRNRISFMKNAFVLYLYGLIQPSPQSLHNSELSWNPEKWPYLQHYRSKTNKFKKAYILFDFSIVFTNKIEGGGGGIPPPPPHQKPKKKEGGGGGNSPSPPHHKTIKTSHQNLGSGYITLGQSMVLILDAGKLVFVENGWQIYECCDLKMH